MNTYLLINPEGFIFFGKYTIMKTYPSRNKGITKEKMVTGEVV